MVAPNYVAARSEMEKRMGLGQVRQNTAPRKRGRPSNGYARNRPFHKLVEALSNIQTESGVHFTWPKVVTSTTVHPSSNFRTAPKMPNGSGRPASSKVRCNMSRS
jgi:hypothetical protein